MFDLLEFVFEVFGEALLGGFVYVLTQVFNTVAEIVRQIWTAI